MSVTTEDIERVKPEWVYFLRRVSDYRRLNQGLLGRLGRALNLLAIGEEGRRSQQALDKFRTWAIVDARDIASSQCPDTVDQFWKHEYGMCECCVDGEFVPW